MPLVQPFGETAEPPFSDALAKLATKRERPILSLVADMDPLGVDALRSIVGQLAGYEKLSVLLESPGGNYDHAHRMLLAMRRHVSNIEILVPFWAKSAATFFCLGADTIHLGPDGELGPLDPQIIDRSGNSRDASALETFKALDQLLRYSLDTLDVLTRHLMRTAHMDFPHAIDRTQQLFAAIVTPLYQQIDPHELGEAGRYLSEGEEYARHVMRRWTYRDSTPEERSLIVRRLVWDYPSHGFVIDLHEARNIGLHVQRLDAESDILCKVVVSAIEQTVGNHISIYLPDDQTDQQSNEPDPMEVDLPQEETHAESATENSPMETDAEDSVSRPA